MTHRRMSEAETEHAEAVSTGIFFLTLSQLFGFAVMHLLVNDGVLGVYLATAALLFLSMVGPAE